MATCKTPDPIKHDVSSTRLNALHGSNPPSDVGESHGVVLALCIGVTVAVFLVASIARVWYDLIHWHDSQRLLQCLLLLSVGSACVLDGAMREQLLVQAARAGTACAAILLAALGLGVISACVSGFWRFALLEVSLLSLLMLTALCVMTARQRNQDSFDTAALTTIVIVATVLVVQFMSAYAAAMTSGTGFYPENLYRAGFSNPRFLAQFHTLALPMLVTACLHPAFPLRWRGAIFAVLSLTLVMALLTASRGSWYAWISATLVVVALFRLPMRSMLVVQLSAIACAGAMFYAMFILPSMFIDGWNFSAIDASFGRLSNPLGLSMRDVVWARAIELIVAFPGLGIGPMGLAVDLNHVAAHPHNALLQIAAEWGLPAAVLLVSAGALAGLRMASGLRRLSAESGSSGASKRIGAALAVSLTGAVVHSMVDGVVVMPYTQTLLAAVVGWSGAVLLPVAFQPRFVPSSSRRSLVAAGIGVAMVALVNGIASDVLMIELREDAFVVNHSKAVASIPRFWAQGFLVDQVVAEDARFAALLADRAIPKGR